MDGYLSFFWKFVISTEGRPAILDLPDKLSKFSDFLSSFYCFLVALPSLTIRLALKIYLIEEFYAEKTVRLKLKKVPSSHPCPLERRTINTIYTKIKNWFNEFIHIPKDELESLVLKSNFFQRC